MPVKRLPAVPREPHEGAHWRYARGCRCAACREAWRVYRKPKVAAYQRARRKRDAATEGRKLMTPQEAGRLGGLAKGVSYKKRNSSGEAG